MKAIILSIILFASMTHAQPWTPHVLWDRSGAEDSSRYGIVVPLGDQNQDGYADFIVWGLGWGPPGQPSEELVDFFHGGNPPSQIPYLTMHGQSGVFILRGIWAVGDLNGDSTIDWMTRVLYLNDPDHFQYRFYWGGLGADSLPDMTFSLTVDWWVLPAGDFNGDGFDDLYIYHSDHDYGEVLYGGNPMDTIPDWTWHTPAGHLQDALPLSFGDINGDGSCDFVSADHNSQTTYIFMGGAHPDTIPAFTLSATYSAYEVILPSLNADNHADLVLSGYPHWALHLGGPNISPIPSFVMNFYINCDWNTAMGLRDITGDGFNDMCVIDPGCNNLWGTLGLYLGHPWLNADPAVVIQGRTPPLNLVGINNAAGLGDINGDGVDDWAIGAFNGDFDGFRGRVVILSGDTTIHVAASDPFIFHPSSIRLSCYPNPFNADATFEMDLPIYSSHAKLSIFNLLGQTMREVNLNIVSLETVYHFDGQDLPSGIYLLRASAGDLQTTKKIMLLK